MTLENRDRWIAIAEKGYFTELETMRLREEVFSTQFDGSPEHEPTRFSSEQMDFAFDLAEIAREGCIEWQLLFSAICASYFMERRGERYTMGVEKFVIAASCFADMQGNPMAMHAVSNMERLTDRSLLLLKKMVSDQNPVQKQAA